MELNIKRIVSVLISCNFWLRASKLLSAFSSEQVRERKKEPVDSGIVEKVFRPVFKSVPADQTVREGTCVRLDCVISARPTAEVIWYRNGQPVVQDQLHKVLQLSF